jgi:RNA polymerase sigma-70 factor (ECF subfamily)
MLYNRYYSAALLYLTAMCSDAELAKDIVADAFVKAYISLPQEIPSFQFWLFRVCKNLWIDHLRKQHKLLSEEHLLTVADHQTPESRYLDNERYRCLWLGISSLPPIDREIVTLHYFSNLPLTDVARLVGKSYPAVRQRLSRLRQILKQRMEEQGYDF